MRRLIAILLMLWFPVQGWAALAMPVCQHSAGQTQAAQMLVAEMPDHCTQHGDQEQAGEGKTTAKLQCDHCAACHLAQAHMLMPPLMSLSEPQPAQRAENAAVFYYQLFLEQPQRPPLSPV